MMFKQQRRELDIERDYIFPVCLGVWVFVSMSMSTHESLIESILIGFFLALFGCFVRRIYLHLESKKEFAVNSMIIIENSREHFFNVTHHSIKAKRVRPKLRLIKNAAA